VAELEVNGQLHEVGAANETPLLYVLRNDLGLTGTKLGCALEQCGACTVLLDGEPRMSCRLPLGEAIGHRVLTVEGLGTREAPHPLQRAFLEENAAQCGFCTAGILVRAKALLDRNRDPSERDVRVALRDNLCRCGAHNRVVRAVLRAAREEKSP
jgi:nicotinate dehydrogenase subunit A